MSNERLEEMPSEEPPKAEEVSLLDHEKAREKQRGLETVMKAPSPSHKINDLEEMPNEEPPRAKEVSPLDHEKAREKERVGSQTRVPASSTQKGLSGGLEEMPTDEPQKPDKISSVDHEKAREKRAAAVAELMPTEDPPKLISSLELEKKAKEKQAIPKLTSDGVHDSSSVRSNPTVASRSSNSRTASRGLPEKFRRATVPEQEEIQQSPNLVDGGRRSRGLPSKFRPSERTTECQSEQIDHIESADATAHSAPTLDILPTIVDDAEHESVLPGAFRVYPFGRTDSDSHNGDTIMTPPRDGTEWPVSDARNTDLGIPAGCQFADEEPVDDVSKWGLTRRRLLFILAILIIVTAIGVGVGLGMAGGKGGGGGNDASDDSLDEPITSTPGPTPVPVGCDTIYDNLPTALRSCLCVNEVKGMHDEVLTVYASLKTEFAAFVLPSFDYESTSCHPNNVALYGLAEDILESDPPAETWQNRYLLSSLFHSWTGDDPFRWEKLSRWLTADSECSWFGVMCSESGEIEELRLPNNNLSPSGGLPEELFALTALKVLDLSFNYLEIPSVSNRINRLRSLETLNLSSNKVGGELPLQHFPQSLVTVKVADVQLLSSLSTDIGHLTSLVTIDMSFAFLNGDVPSEIGLLTELRLLRLSHNQFRNMVPSEIGSLTLLETLDFSRNGNMRATVFSEIGQLVNLVELDFIFTPLFGSLPTEIGLLSKLTALGMEGHGAQDALESIRNGLEDELPSEVGQLTSLVILDLAGNRLQAQIPTEIGLLSRIEKIDLGNNLFTGAIPQEISMLSSLRSLRLRGRIISPGSGGAGQNEISGTFPPDLFELENLECLDVSGTLLNGLVPEGLCDNADAYVNIRCVGTTPCDCCFCDGPDKCEASESVIP